MITLSIVIPTMGRDTLARTLESIRPQMQPRDELLLICDGYTVVDELSCLADKEILVCVETQPQWAKNPGGTQRNAVLDNLFASGDYLLWCGDDDIYLPGALNAARTHAEANPGRPLMFRMITPCGAHPWQEGDRGRIERNYVGDHMFVAPNRPLWLGRFGPTYSGDYDFIRSTMDLYGSDDRLVWCPETLVHCRPEGR